MLILLIKFLLQACAFRDSYEKFKKAGAVVVGISGDDPSSHKVKINGFAVCACFKFNLPCKFYSECTVWNVGICQQVQTSIYLVE